VTTCAPDPQRTLARGELAALAYRLGRQAASGVLTVSASVGRPEVFVLRRGAAVCGEGEPARRELAARLGRVAGEALSVAAFQGGVAACPPAILVQIPLAGWARSHLESQLDAALADQVVRELAGSRLSLRAELAPAPLDQADRRMLAALAQPQRLDQLWPAARAPRFRLLALLHFLRSVGALAIDSVGAARAGSAASHSEALRCTAMRLLGVGDGDGADAIKRAYRRLARALHPDLQPEADEPRRRALERRFAEISAAYEALQ
jgi:hypothetical protein